MTGLVVLLVSLTLAGVLGWAGALKVRGHASTRRGARVVDEMSQWRILRVPAPLRTEAAVRAHPWAELALAAGLLLAPSGWPARLVAVAVLLLCLAYWLVIAHALARRIPTTCSCFGAGRQSPVSPVSLARNTLLVGLAVAAVVLAWRGHGALGSVAGLGPAGWSALAAAAAGAALAAIVAVESQPDLAPVQELPDRPVRQQMAGPEPGELDYVRTRTPNLALMTAEGEQAPLRQLSSQRPVLLYFVSTTCGSCIEVADRVPRWRERLPMVDHHLVTRTPLAVVAEQRPTWSGVLHDDNGVVGSSLDAAATPTAVLLGVDGMLAGGPVTGTAAIEALVREVEEALVGDAAPASGDLSG